MLLPLILLLQGPAPRGTPSSGAPHPTPRVSIPRAEADITIDGKLDEKVWTDATLLNGFTQFAPSDGTPAADSTHVLVWYSPNAIYFGIRAYEAHGRPHVSQADRDAIFSDDNVQLLLGTFPGGQQAVMFAVNAFGQQGDGVMIDNGSQPGGGRPQTDLSSNFVFESRGHLTDWGYEVEVRIPFRSLRYPSGTEQEWQFNVVREVKHSGDNDSWAPIVRANSSFLGQSGTLTGLHDLHRGLVIDANPEVSDRVVGTPGTGGFTHTAENPQLGGNIRWSVSTNLTLNGTAKPDYSQVESDAGQLSFDPRQALFFPEKRPFFLDGSEQFQTPFTLVYTRRISQPVAALKLTGNIAGNGVGFLSAVDGRFASIDGNSNPVFNVMRVQHNLPGQSRIGITYTNRSEDARGNEVGGIDGRILLKHNYAFQFQVSESKTHQGDSTWSGPLWWGQFVANGKHFGLTTGLQGISDKFNADAGFIGRNNYAALNIDPRASFYGKPGSLVENVNTDVQLYTTWRYQDLVNGRYRQDQKLHFNGNATLRGGWQVVTGWYFESFGYDSSLYASYAVEVPRQGGGLDTIPFHGRPTIPNSEGFLQVSTPQWKKLNATVWTVLGHDEDFPEWASGQLKFWHADISWRPTTRARVSASYDLQQVDRRSDGSVITVGKLPRLKLEYQLSRSVFLRLVGQYTEQFTDSLRDETGSGAPILKKGSDGYHRTAIQSSNFLEGDALFSYQPIPGTVVFLGYSGLQSELNPFHFSDLTRQGESFFAKVSYTFRL